MRQQWRALEKIPPSRTNNPARSETDIPLDVAFYALQNHPLRGLPSTRAGAQFKVALCRRALEGAAGNGKPKAHARPRARRGRPRADSAGEAEPAGEGENEDSPSVARKPTSIPSAEVLALLVRPGGTGSDAPSVVAAVLAALCLKAELVAAYGRLQARRARTTLSGTQPAVAVHAQQLAAFDDDVDERAVELVEARKDMATLAVEVLEASI
ncbi:uncharacterized protein BXZ73DRAFT_77794 [Epithele typhae]|uniref:uncharacterized protein n=1 Tax=Epithele typhae TaxID=378194 RepID=UPI0020079851|nr:uncharacterized protein BXZ73DRAFT_77794 [Epithele typhae]KAH9931111.1 hypothetical protein BXZ73DRAFT_77794 [Epithele typhae]